MTSADFLNYALGFGAIVGALGTGSISLMTLLKTIKVETHTNGMVKVLTEKAASEARVDERHDNVERGGTTGKETLK